MFTATAFVGAPHCWPAGTVSVTEPAGHFTGAAGAGAAAQFEPGGRVFPASGPPVHRTGAGAGAGAGGAAAAGGTYV
ncbi:hypothetical protein BST44_19250 [Mycobacterium scrofulaceum]|uniref:Uncharacterized protein n=1 Tax=Mycobacterium scrofulaceum TaxID=1783 RepID=A0A1X0KBL2_MYCSC|nr:hypothetical protein BST44_19250 [Mycobacterium scrofulaceum]